VNGERSSAGAGVRCAGISIPLFSLRSERDGGIGDFSDLDPFCDWAATFGQSVVAVLPLGELGPGEASPYHALSSFALDPIFLRPDALPELYGERMDSAPDCDEVRHDAVRARKTPLFDEAFRRFLAAPEDHPRRWRCARFRDRARGWLSDYALFRALLEANPSLTVLAPDYYSGNEIMAIRAAGARTATSPSARMRPSRTSAVGVM
jgi:4-alpha-glucanotransferase